MRGTWPQEQPILTDGVVLGMARFNRILEVDYANRCAVVQPGVTNLAISHAVMTRHGGSIDCLSRSGEGTTFFLRFPLEDGQTQHGAA